MNKKSGDWIDLNHRSPKPGVDVIWYHPKLTRNGRGDIYSSLIRIGSYNLTSRPATHWMPLPEPPK